MRLAVVALALLLSSCATTSTVREQQAPLATFDCLREKNLGVVSAHRAGPQAGLPENALETMRASARAGIEIVEIDIGKTKDGALVLLHDDRLERTTTGTGLLSERTLAELGSVRLKDNDGKVTPSRIPTLDATFRELKRDNLMAQLDLKRNSGVTEADVAAAARRAAVLNRVVLITYNDAQAIAAAKADPVIMVSATVNDEAQLERLIAGGLAAERILAWTGTRQPNPALKATLRARGVEVIFGTLGRPGQRLDDQYAADGDDSEYLDLVRQGVTMIATDRPRQAEAVLMKARGGGSVFNACPLPK
jgi:glycerophosphoryl diester phosphodiesterase